MGELALFTVCLVNIGILRRHVLDCGSRDVAGQKAAVKIPEALLDN